MEQLARQQCGTAFETYVGIPPEQSQLRISVVYPGQEAWESGNRRGGCALFGPGDQGLTGSMLGEER